MTNDEWKKRKLEENLPKIKVCEKCKEKEKKKEVEKKKLFMELSSGTDSVT